LASSGPSLDPRHRADSVRPQTGSLGEERQSSTMMERLRNHICGMAGTQTQHFSAFFDQLSQVQSSWSFESGLLRAKHLISDRESGTYSRREARPNISCRLERWRYWTLVAPVASVSVRPFGRQHWEKESPFWEFQGIGTILTPPDDLHSLFALWFF
jgi:hypothetical protein